MTTTTAPKIIKAAKAKPVTKQEDDDFATNAGEAVHNAVTYVGEKAVDGVSAVASGVWRFIRTAAVGKD